MLSALHLTANTRAFGEAVGLLGRYRGLTWEMARREISSQYAGQLFGTLWAVGHPLFMLGLYLFIFGVVFRQRIGGTFELPLDYTTYIFAGLVPWLSFQQSMTRACTSLTGEANLVKQVVFPIEILPTKVVIASLVPQAVGLAVLIGYVLIQHGALHWTYVLLPALVTLQILAMLGVAMAFAALSVFLRDLKDFVGLFATAGVYLMPVFYLPDWVPPVFKPVLHVNPFSYMVWCYQDALYFGRFAHPWAWVVFVIGSPLVFAVGYRLFRKLKPSFGNAL